MFIDRVRLKLTAGKGGNGVISWRREKYIPKGGPAGGNGGRGGSIIIRADEGVVSLEAFRHHRLVKARGGAAGGGSQKQGKGGEDLLLKVPCGTIVKNATTQEVLIDLTTPQQEYRACEGGRGGRGNASFRTPSHQAPAVCTPGTLGTELDVELELKLIADIGLVGFPNAGKSTLISKVAGIAVKIAPYPFTTLRPNLGYIEFEDYSRLLIADIPGIIAGAHQNRGLGLEFLRHIERTKVLLFIVDGSGIDGRSPIDDLRVLRQELAAYDPELLARPYVVALNKVDTEEGLAAAVAFREAYSLDAPLFEISALSGFNLKPLISRLRLMAGGLPAARLEWVSSVAINSART